MLWTETETLPETNMTSLLKRDGWNTILAYWVSAYFAGAKMMLVSGSVSSNIMKI